jgi:hypothetical protein
MMKSTLTVEVTSDMFVDALCATMARAGRTDAEIQAAADTTNAWLAENWQSVVAEFHAGLKAAMSLGAK